MRVDPARPSLILESLCEQDYTRFIKVSATRVALFTTPMPSGARVSIKWEGRGHGGTRRTNEVERVSRFAAQNTDALCIGEHSLQRRDVSQVDLLRPKPQRDQDQQRAPLTVAQAWGVMNTHTGVSMHQLQRTERSELPRIH